MLDDDRYALSLGKWINFCGALQIDSAPLKVLDVQSQHVRGDRVVLEAASVDDHAETCA